MRGKTVIRKVTAQVNGSDVKATYIWDDDIAQLVKDIHADFDVPVFNAQFRRYGGRYYCIDFGARLSGASGMANALGCNLIDVMFGSLSNNVVKGSVYRRYENVEYVEN